MCSAGSAWTLLQTGCPIRIPPDHRLLPTPRRFSQVAASFFGSWCLGIHHGPLVACSTYNHSSVTEAWLGFEDPNFQGAAHKGPLPPSPRGKGLCRWHSLSLFGCQGAGGDERTRTADPLLAKQVLSQLSYIPAHGSNLTVSSVSCDVRSGRLP